VNAIDHEGNTPLHSKCAGELNKPIELKAINVLHDYGAEIGKLNSNGETCFHLGARNGRTEVLQLLFELNEDTIRESVQTIEQQENKLSILALALRADHLESATW
jgi:ankyrin repeat protein